MQDSSKLQISLPLPATLVSTLDRIATAVEQDRAWVVQRALDQYLEQEGAEILQDLQGIEELDRGESVDLEDVLARANAIVDAAELRLRKRAG